MATTRALVSAWCVLATACVQSDGQPQLIEKRFFAMGTWVDVSLVSRDPAATDAAFQEIESTLERYERDFYPWTDGELAAINDAIAGNRDIEVSTEMAALLTRARDLAAASGGLFEPGLGRLVELWGFHMTPIADLQPPSPEAISAALEAGGGIAALEIDGQSVRSTARGLKVDLGGIAKGAVVDAILASIERHGIGAALVNAGGDLAVAGQPLGARPWRVGIRDPRARDLLGVLELADGEAAFTSGDYERFYESQGRRLHHLLDPATGHPIVHTQAVTVIATDPTNADAAATALFVAGPDRWSVVANRLGVDAVLRVDSSGEVESTPAMAARLQAAGVDRDIIIGSGQESPQ